jgi:hypothetical protein
VDESNLAQAKELAASALPDSGRPVKNEPSTAPQRVPIAPDKPLHIPNLQTDRQGTFDFISWWERDKVRDARVLVVGAGALGNEVIKNLALMGVGHLFIVDFDTIEAANLSRSVLANPCPVFQRGCHHRPWAGRIPPHGRGRRLPG